MTEGNFDVGYKHNTVEEKPRKNRDVCQVHFYFINRNYKRLELYTYT